jgi:hypothetical protein
MKAIVFSFKRMVRGDTHQGGDEYIAASREDKPFLAVIFYGTTIERMVAKKIDTSKFSRLGGPNKPDFKGINEYEGLLFDITTEKAIPEHKSRPYGKELNFATYERPENFKIFPK